MLVRGFCPEDLHAIAALNRAEGWPSLSEDAERALTALTAPGVIARVAEDEGGVVGFAMALSDFETTTYLSNLVVAADRRREGIGQALIDAVFEVSGLDRLDLLSEDVSEAFYERPPHRRMPGFRLYSKAAVERYEREERGG